MSTYIVAQEFSGASFHISAARHMQQFYFGNQHPYAFLSENAIFLKINLCLLTENNTLLCVIFSFILCWTNRSHNIYRQCYGGSLVHSIFLSRDETTRSFLINFILYFFSFSGIPAFETKHFQTLYSIFRINNFLHRTFSSQLHTTSTVRFTVRRDSAWNLLASYRCRCTAKGMWTPDQCILHGQKSVDACSIYITEQFCPQISHCVPVLVFCFPLNVIYPKKSSNFDPSPQFKEYWFNSTTVSMWINQKTNRLQYIMLTSSILARKKDDSP